MSYDVELTRYSRDGGCDVHARRCSPTGQSLMIIDRKAYAPDNPVEVEKVRTLFGMIHHANALRSMLATTSYFTHGAREFDRQHEYRVSLQDRHAVLRWVRDS